MRGINKVTLIGNLGHAPEVRTTQDGKKIVTLNLATSEQWKDRQSGERRERTEWHRIVIFNENLADLAEKYLVKGSKIFIEGQLQTRQWEKNGEKRYTTEVVLQNFRGELMMLDNKQGGINPDHLNGPARTPAPAGGFDDLDDEIPF